MSAPNSSYDPVEVTPLRSDEIERMRDEALAAVAAARSLDDLKQVRIDHVGDRSPIALANREIVTSFEITTTLVAVEKFVGAGLAAAIAAT